MTTLQVSHREEKNGWVLGMAAISPVNSHRGSNQEHALDTSSYGSSESLAGAKSPRYVNLGFLKNLTERKTTRGT